eukprot:CAMPEP_0115373462 /NCGR_PEP_ID=MMETSP0271-20121206/1445_1 /TAXON_ID=71861 /ORGANISM="Scrippsiella trochoidea, Strain CCMP3099" /LENGTH=84 /DNA_ID=CAMNT_0002796467 /DNA_START=310 /DNA_END=561 /DNA_ORIENTATION=-
MGAKSGECIAYFIGRGKHSAPNQSTLLSIDGCLNLGRRREDRNHRAKILFTFFVDEAEARQQHFKSICQGQHPGYDRGSILANA